MMLHTRITTIPFMADLQALRRTSSNLGAAHIECESWCLGGSALLGVSLWAQLFAVNRIFSRALRRSQEMAPGIRTVC